VGLAYGGGLAAHELGDLAIAQLAVVAKLDHLALIVRQAPQMRSQLSARDHHPGRLFG
jgi:hypothetical protein